MPYKILSYEQIERTEWSRLVQSSSTGTWFQTPEAYDFFSSMPELFMPFAIAITDGEIRGICCGYVTVEKNSIKQFFMRRAIVIGGPALDDDCTEEEVETLMTAVRAQLTNFKSQVSNFKYSPIYIETRNFNDYSRWRTAFVKAGFSYQPHLNFHVDCLDSKAMWERLSDNRKRQIRRATSEGVCEFESEKVSEQDVREWYKVLQRLYSTKVKTPLWPEEFFLEVYRQGIGRFIMVRYEEDIIGGSMVVEDEKAVYEWFECGLNAEYKDQYPSVVATYAGMVYASEHGVPRYDMMGAGVPGTPYGVRDFKAEFGGMMVEHGRFLNVCNPSLFWLGELYVMLIRKTIS